MKEPKPALVVALGMKPKPAKEVKAGGDPMGPTGLPAAADEVFNSLKSGNRQAFSTALKAFVEMCSDSYEE